MAAHNYDGDMLTDEIAQVREQEGERQRERKNPTPSTLIPKPSTLNPQP